MSSKTGIDKIHLTTKDFEVKSLKSHHFGIDTGMKQGGKFPPYLLTDKTGEAVNAWKAFHNSEKKIGNYTISDKGLLVIFNPSKMWHPYHLVSTSDQKYSDALKMIDTEMKSIGISCDLSEMKPCRIDIAAQNQMRFPLFQYAAAFKLLKMSHAKNQKQYEGGFMFGNKSSKTIFYDKKLELQANKLDAILQGENNFLRGEIRTENAKAVTSILPIKNLSELSCLSSLEIDNVYKTFLNKRIFSRQYISDQLHFDFYGEVEILKTYMDQYKQHAWLKYLAETSIDIILLKYGSIDNFGDLLKSAGYKKTSVHNIKKQCSMMLSRKAFHDNKRGEVTTATLLSELQEKFAA